MKQARILPTILLLICLCGCHLSEKPASEIAFYYPSLELQADTENAGLIPYAMPDASLHDIDTLLNQYLLTSEFARLHSPFAQDVRLLRWTLSGETLELVFTDTLSQMPSYEITLACSALSATLFQLEQIRHIDIRCETAPLNNMPALSFTPASISWLDTISTDIITETEATK